MPYLKRYTSMQSVSCFSLPGALCTILQVIVEFDGWEPMLKKFTYSIVGIFLFVIAESVLSGALELHSAISNRVQHFESFPESGWLIVIGSFLIFSASFLRRRRAARAR